MIELSLGEIQKLQIELMSEIDDVCRKNEIQYCIMYGSMLGAIRHGGFIPWDDDIDIVLDRTNYEKLVTVLQKNHRNDRFIENSFNDRFFEIPMTRYCCKNTYCEVYERKKLKSNKNIYIDILPVDNLPNDETEALKQIRTVDKVRRIIYYKMHYAYKHKTKFGYLKSDLYAFLTYFIPLKYLLKKMEKEMKKFSSVQTNRVVNFNTAYNYDKDTFLKKDLFPPKEIVFSRNLFYGCANPDKVLKQLYGDYMILPSLEKRAQRHPCYLLEKGDNGYE